MAERKWTEGQKNCIDARGGTVIVSAAAGSGKTAVLIERIISLICDKSHPLSVDNLLVVTFTKAAAAEMRSRLHQRLAEKIALDPHNRHLQRQQLLLPQASISTVHSFCGKLLKEFAPSVGISPRFQVAESTALDLMKNDVANRVIEEAYAAGHPDFLRLCDQLATDKNDSNIAEHLLRIYDFIQAHPFPMQWLDRQQAQFDGCTAIGDTVWGQIILAQVKSDLIDAERMMQTACDAVVNDEQLSVKYKPSMTQSLADIRKAIAAVDQGWDATYHAVSSIQFKGLTRVSKYEDTAFKIYVQELRNYAKNLIEDHVVPSIINDEKESLAAITAAAPIITQLFDLIRRFDEQFTAAKREQNRLDFSDLEHLTLSLLAEPNADGSFTRTAIAKEIGSRFTHIMVDEYQDTNATQDTLFSALSDEERNLFFVGDIKQSIYGFRHAMPSIFRNRRDDCTAYDGERYPAAITLGNNFRSRKQVTESVNYLFRQLMTKETGGIIYDEREKLVSSAAFAEADNDAFNTELMILQTSLMEEDVKTYVAEARLIGEKIHSMIQSGFSVSQGNGLRPATYRDFCILLRSTSTTAPIYLKELQAMGIPVTTGSKDNFFDCAEIKVALSIIRAIDNPLIDIPLLGAMMSPIFGFSPDDVTLIRQAQPQGTLYASLRTAVKATSALAEKCRAFLDFLDNYRTLSVSMSADKLIRRLFDDTDMLSIMSAKNSGQTRTANLRKLYDLARRFEDRDARGLSAFLRYLDRLEEKEITVESASISSQNAVQIMTIHGSKGLEFPVVFTAALTKPFSNKSVINSILLHAEHGIGMTLHDREALQTFDSIHHKALSMIIKQEEHTEELRLLYVAMTRAKDKLIMVATVANLAKKLQTLQPTQITSGTLPTSFILHTSNAGNWVMAAFMNHEAGRILREYIEGDTPPPCSADGLTISVTFPKGLEESTDNLDEDTPSICLDDLENRLTYQYPYAALGHIAAKLTASKAAHSVPSDHNVTLNRPAFLSKTGLSPAQRGTATHLFLEHATLSGGQSAAKQAATLVANGIITKQQADALNVRALDRFLNSDLAVRMSKADRLLKEFPFAFECPVERLDIAREQLPADALQENIMVQGIADAIMIENDRAVIIDYKTDRVNDGHELEERYRAQLAIYKEAVERALHLTVSECLIYSFHLHDTISLDM